MKEDFIRNRITQLRMQKNVSEYKMSIELGHSKGYIQSITSGRSLPSMNEFLSICDYFEITPHEFFNESDKNILITKEFLNTVIELSHDDLLLLIQIANRLKKD